MWVGLQADVAGIAPTLDRRQARARGIVFHLGLASRTDASRSIAVTDPVAAWHTEHAYFAQLLRLLRREIDVIHAGEDPNYELMVDILSYLHEYADRVHHPREDVAFARLARHCPDMKVVLGRLEQEHRVIETAGIELLSRIEAAVGGEVVPREKIEAAAATFLVYYESHLAREESEVLARADELGDLLAREEGKTLPEARGEVVRAGQILKFFAGDVLQPHGHVVDSVRPGVEVSVTREPLGVVSVIVPWNFPMPIAGCGFAPALAAGNTVVLKPAELTPLTAIRLGELALQAGLPEGLVPPLRDRGLQGLSADELGAHVLHYQRHRHTALAEPGQLELLTDPGQGPVVGLLDRLGRDLDAELDLVLACGVDVRLHCLVLRLSPARPAERHGGAADRRVVMMGVGLGRWCG